MTPRPVRFTRRLRQMVEWIAFNDNSGNGDTEEGISQYVTTVMLAHVYDVAYNRLAYEIAEVRRANGLPVGEPAAS